MTTRDDFFDLVCDGETLDTDTVMAEYDRLTAESAQLMAEIAAMREAARWIPVGERLPEMYQHVETYSDNTLSFTQFQYGSYSGDYQAQDGEYFWTFTHWRPLPAAPEVQS